MREAAAAYRALSVHVGRPEPFEVAEGDWSDKVWTSAFRKRPVSGPVFVTQQGLAGDVQADRESHGGSERAVLAYPGAHYRTWRASLGIRDMPYGGFAENVTVSSVTESDVFIGDTYRAGSALLQVSHPRAPCWKIARRWQIKDLTARVHQTGRTGWFFRVLEEGFIEAGDDFYLLDRPYPQWSIARAYRLVYVERDNVEEARALSECDLLTPGWRAELRRRLGISIADGR